MKRISARWLEQVMTAALLERGLSEDHTRYVVDGLVQTSLRGIDTHGVRLFPVYLAELDGGRARSVPEITWRRGSGTAFEVMDAGGALGLVVGRIAADRAVRLARQFGLGGVLVGGSNHFGAASNYTLEIAKHDHLGLCMSNSDALVASWNGLHPIFGTNPLSVAVKVAEDEFFCADFATSQASYSRVLRHREIGEPLVEGWAMDAKGLDLALRSEDAELHALQPLGNHKGQCLSMIVEILTAVLVGGPLDHELTHLYTEPFDRPRQISHLFLSIDIGAVSDQSGFRSRLAGLLDVVRAQPSIGTEPVVVPGDAEAACKVRRSELGIPVTDEEYRWFTHLGGPDKQPVATQTDGPQPEPDAQGSGGSHS